MLVFIDREQPTLYVPLGPARLGGSLSIVTRTAASPEGLVRPFRDAAQALDGNVSLRSVKTMEQRIAVQLWPFRTVSWLFSICGALALILATTGLAGAVIHAVNRRIREFGVRAVVSRDRRGDRLPESPPGHALDVAWRAHRDPRAGPPVGKLEPTWHGGARALLAGARSPSRFPRGSGCHPADRPPDRRPTAGGRQALPHEVRRRNPLAFFASLAASRETSPLRRVSRGLNPGEPFSFGVPSVFLPCQGFSGQCFFCVPAVASLVGAVLHGHEHDVADHAASRQDQALAVGRQRPVEDEVTD